jgi:predicted ferric reductase
MVIRSIKHFIQNKQSTLIFWSAYLVIHIACMITAYFQYENETIYIRIARMCGNSLNFNCSLILVLVLRKHLTWLRIKGGSKFLPLDESIEIHKKVGIIILILTCIHIISHLIHLYIVDSDRSTQLFLTYIFTLKDNIGYPTGVIQFILLIIILIFASPYVRKRGHFELFYLMHMLTIPWLFIMLIHGFRAFWKWVLIPAVCYAIENVLRYRKTRSNKFGDTFIMESYVLPSKVVYLVIRKPSHFEFKPGDYIFLNIPIIAKYEWHPFSISSAPENSEHIWLHIKATGNWTNKLYEYSQSSKFDSNNVSNLLSASQRSIVRVNMRTKMSNLINNTIDFNSNDKLQTNSNANNMIKKVVSFVPTKEDEQQVDQIDLSKIESSKEVVFYNLNENTPKQENSAGLSLVPQQEQENKQQKSEFKEPANIQLRHKSILKAMSLNCYSMNEQSLQNTNDHPTESTPRSLTNIDDESKTLISQQQQQQQSAFRNRSKSLDHADETDDNSFFKTFKSESNDKLANSSQYQMRLNYTQTENNNNNTQNLIVSEAYTEEKATSAMNETNNYSKNNLILSFENNLTTASVPVVEFSKERPLSTGSENVCFLNMVDTSDEGSNISNSAVRNNENPTKIDMSRNSILDSKPFNSLNKSITSLYNRLKQQVNVGSQVIPSVKREDALGYLKLYQKTNRVNISSIGLDDAWRLKVHIDGPYGTPSSDIFHSEHAVLIAAGIGITPFASILQSLMNQFRQQRAKCPQCDHKISEDILNCGNKHLSIKKVDFIWVTREQRSLEWFISILSKMEMEQKKNNESFLETHLYVTSAKRQSDLRSVSLQITLDAIFSQEESSLIDGLRKRTHHGRPNWDIVLQNLIRKQKGKINVFYCGLPSLANVLQNKCEEYNLTFKKEIF